MAAPSCADQVDHPLGLVLLNSESVPVLLDKFARLNQYFHSHHGQHVIEASEFDLELEHVSSSGSPPAPVESLFVCGVYIALLERVGCRELRCRFPLSDRGDAWAYRGGDVGEVATDGVHRWRLEWDWFEQRRTLPAVDEVLLREPLTNLQDDSVAAVTARVVSRDLGRAWRVGDVAAELALSPRTLQRRLSEEGTSFRETLLHTRVEAAKSQLRDPTMTLRDIGFILGFTDTAHLVRTFKTRTGKTPGQWREAAGQGTWLST